MTFGCAQERKRQGGEVRMGLRVEVSTAGLTEREKIQVAEVVDLGAKQAEHL